MNRICDFSEMGNHLVGAVPEIATGQHCGRMNRYRFDDQHCRSAHRPFAVITQMPFSGNPLISHVGCMGSENDTVAEGFPS